MSGVLLQNWQFLAQEIPPHHNSQTLFLLKNKSQVDATYQFIVILIGSTCFGRYYAYHQELTTIILITTLVVSFLVCCRLEVGCARLEYCPGTTGLFMQCVGVGVVNSLQPGHYSSLRAPNLQPT